MTTTTTTATTIVETKTKTEKKRNEKMCGWEAMYTRHFSAVITLQFNSAFYFCSHLAFIYELYVISFHFILAVFASHSFSFFVICAILYQYFLLTFDY